MAKPLIPYLLFVFGVLGHVEVLWVHASGPYARLLGVLPMYIVGYQIEFSA